MVKETSEIKKAAKIKNKTIKPGGKLKAAIKATKKLKYSDLQQLNVIITQYLEAQKQKQIEYLEQQLKLVKGA